MRGAARAACVQVMLHVDRDTLREGAPTEETGRSELGGSGTRVSCEGI
jgi:Cu/Zn superoxide dismutase